jgi:DNA polymerase-4|tara:strand:+ start:84 stop:542 length:459 start_codon:yes stop_codon:yes gene_type:complete
MLEKACHRLRVTGYFTGHLVLQVKFGFEWRWNQEIKCGHTQDTRALSRLLNLLWESRPVMAPKPTKVAVTLTDLIHTRNYTPSLFETEEDRRQSELLRIMDDIKKNYGNRSLYYANSMMAQKSTESAPMRIAFNHIPDLNIESDVTFNNQKP